MSEEPTVSRFITLDDHEAHALVVALDLAIEALGNNATDYGTRLNAAGVLRSQSKALRQKQRGVAVLREPA